MGTDAEGKKESSGRLKGPELYQAPILIMRILLEYGGRGGKGLSRHEIGGLLKSEYGITASDDYIGKIVDAIMMICGSESGDSYLQSDGTCLRPNVDIQAAANVQARNAKKWYQVIERPLSFDDVYYLLAYADDERAKKLKALLAREDRERLPEGLHNRDTERVGRILRSLGYLNSAISNGRRITFKYPASKNEKRDAERAGIEVDADGRIERTQMLPLKVGMSGGYWYLVATREDTHGDRKRKLRKGSKLSTFEIDKMTGIRFEPAPVLAEVEPDVLTALGARAQKILDAAVGRYISSDIVEGVIVRCRPGKEDMERILLNTFPKAEKLADPKYYGCYRFDANRRGIIDWALRWADTFEVVEPVKEPKRTEEKSLRHQIVARLRDNVYVPMPLEQG